MANRSELSFRNNQYRYNGPTFGRILEYRVFIEKMDVFNLTFKQVLKSFYKIDILSFSLNYLRILASVKIWNKI